MYRRNDGEKERDTYADQGTVEVFREKTIEDLIDEQRAKLAAEGKVRRCSQ
jgi:hypothetical protein